MKNVFFLSCIAILALASCQQGGFKNGKNGMQYKLVSNGGKDSLKVGDYVQFSQVVKFGDSAALNTYEAGSQFAKVDSIDAPFTINEIFKKLALNDSAMVKYSTDSIYAFQYASAKVNGVTKEQFDQQIPPFFKKKGSYVTVGIKILKKYATDSLMMVDVKAQEPLRQAYQDKMQKKQKEDQDKKDAVGFKDSKAAFDKYVGINASKWLKTASGSYVEIITEGTGEACAPGKVAMIRYIGKLMDGGKVFDTNVKGAKPGDTTTKELLPATIGAGGLIKGFDEGIALLKKGTVAKLYIPSEAGYGGRAMGDDLPAYANLVFDITVEDVKAAPPTPKQATPQAGMPKMTPEQQAQMQKAMQEAQQKQAAGKQ